MNCTHPSMNAPAFWEIRRGPTTRLSSLPSTRCTQHQVPPAYPAAQAWRCSSGALISGTAGKSPGNSGDHKTLEGPRVPGHSSVRRPRLPRSQKLNPKLEALPPGGPTRDDRPNCHQVGIVHSFIFLLWWYDVLPCCRLRPYPTSSPAPMFTFCLLRSGMRQAPAASTPFFSCEPMVSVRHSCTAATLT